ncbi:MAG: single-stranded-DNA-specific exonuclease RecJ [Clostridiales bacterium]|nr:single-stranded-DNA-specific exonuclease RecJ [Clostridiales bacterium]
MAKWGLIETDADLKLMCKVLGVDEIIATILANRDIRTKNTAVRYLWPEYKFFFDTSKMKDILKAIEIVIGSIKNKDRVAIYGDYDVDGVTSTVILVKALRQLGADVIYYIPDRGQEGYGLNLGAVTKLKSFEVDLVITCDNGIAALEEIKALKNNSIKVVVIDHHEPDFVETNGARSSVTPKADAIVDPKQEDCSYPFKMMCAAGMSYKFCKLLYEKLKKPFDIDDEFLIFAMIGTFCDIVDLVEENRIIAKKGLEAINKKEVPNIGLKALLKEKNLSGKVIGSYDIGFLIGPCINATGRLLRATIAVELFLETDWLEACRYAEILSRLNEERKKATNDAVKNSLQLLEDKPEYLTKIIVLYDENVNESVAGIVAGRIKDAFYRPAIVLTKGETCVKGSARSIEAYNIFEGLNNNRELFIRFGGHKMAAGLSMDEKNIETLKNRLNSTCTLTDDDFVELIHIDKKLNLGDITMELAYKIKSLEPFGKGNREPIFLTENVDISELRLIEEKNTIIFSIGEKSLYKKIRAVCFGKVEDFKRMVRNLYDDNTCDMIIAGSLTKLKADIVYNIGLNEYRGNISVNLKIRDLKIYK